MGNLNSKDRDYCASIPTIQIQRLPHEKLNAGGSKMAAEGTTGCRTVCE